MNIEEENWANAERCIAKADIAFSKNNLDKAESLLKKAERIYPTQLAKQKLEDIRVARNRNNVNGVQNEPRANNSNDNNTDVEAEPEIPEERTTDRHMYHRSELDQRHAETCIEIAKIAIAKYDFNRARRFILKSSRLYPSTECDELFEELKQLIIKSSSTTYNTNGTLRCKEDAETCIEVAQNEFAAGKLARAERILWKAERLFPTARAKDLLKQIENARARGQPEVAAAGEERRTPQVEQEPPPQRPRGPTDRQLEAIRRVNNARDDYEMFSLERGCSEADIDRAHRRLAAQLHPDKNKAPGASEAFRSVGEACNRIKKAINRRS